MGVVMLFLRIVRAGHRIVTCGKNLERMGHGPKSKTLGYSVTYLVDALIAKLLNMPTLDAYQVVMVRHPAGKLKMGTPTLKPMLHQDTARGQ
ncbi:MAG: hypothetical protein RIR53_1168 [Bacteroidota bacterium]